MPKIYNANDRPIKEGNSLEYIVLFQYKKQSILSISYKVGQIVKHLFKQFPWETTYINKIYDK